MELLQFTLYPQNMTVTLPDDPALLHLDENQLRVDIACSLFAAGRISRSVAARIAGLESLPFDEELFRRKIPSYTSEMLDQDLAAWGEMSGA